MTDLAIIIVSHNTKTDLLRCVESLRVHPPRASHEIVVIDNASQDGSVDAVRAAWPDVRVIEAGGNVGFARANNTATRSTASDLLLFLNSDTIVPARAIDALVSVMRSRPDAAVVGPRLVDAAGRAELSFGRMMGPFNELFQKILGGLYARRVPGVSQAIAYRLERMRTPDWVSGACLLVRRADAEAVDLFDERFFMYGEDVDFCAAIRRRGRVVLFSPSVEIVHLGGRSRATAPTVTAAAYRRSQLAFYDKHHPRWLPLLRAYLRVRGKLPDEV